VIRFWQNQNLAFPKHSIFYSYDWTDSAFRK